MRRPKKGPGHHVQDIIGAIAQGDLIAADTQFLRQGRFQFETAPIGIEMQVRQGSRRRLKRQWAGSQWIFVRRQLDDIADSQLAFEFGNRLPRHVGTEGLHAFNRKIQWTHGVQSGLIK